MSPSLGCQKLLSKRQKTDDWGKTIVKKTKKINGEKQLLKRQKTDDWGKCG